MSAAQLWTAALRSNSYQQGRGQLASETDEGVFYCCLGVACDLYEKHVKKIGPQRVTLMGDQPFVITDGYTQLPYEVMEWLGLRDSVGIHDSGNLANMNDAGISFDDIADVIDSRPPGMFWGEPCFALSR